MSKLLYTLPSNSHNVICTNETNIFLGFNNNLLVFDKLKIDTFSQDFYISALAATLKYVAVGSKNGSVKILSLASSNLDVYLHVSITESPIKRLCFGNSGECLWIEDDDGGISLLNLSKKTVQVTLKLPGSLQSAEAGGVYYLLTREGTIQMWLSKSGEYVDEITADSNIICFAAASHSLFSCSTDTVIRKWDFNESTFEPLTTQSFTSLILLNDCFFAGLCSDNSLKVFDFEGMLHWQFHVNDEVISFASVDLGFKALVILTKSGKLLVEPLHIFSSSETSPDLLDTQSIVNTSTTDSDTMSNSAYQMATLWKSHLALLQHTMQSIKSSKLKVDIDLDHFHRSMAIQKSPLYADNTYSQHNLITFASKPLRTWSRDDDWDSDVELDNNECWWRKIQAHKHIFSNQNRPMIQLVNPKSLINNNQLSPANDHPLSPNNTTTKFVYNEHLESQESSPGISLENMRSQKTQEQSLAGDKHCIQITFKSSEQSPEHKKLEQTPGKSKSGWIKSIVDQNWSKDPQDSPSPSSSSSTNEPFQSKINLLKKRSIAALPKLFSGSSDQHSTNQNDGNSRVNQSSSSSHKPQTSLETWGFVPSWLRKSNLK